MIQTTAVLWHEYIGSGSWNATLNGWMVSITPLKYYTFLVPRDKCLELIINMWHIQNGKNVDMMHVTHIGLSKYVLVAAFILQFDWKLWAWNQNNEALIPAEIPIFCMGTLCFCFLNVIAISPVLIVNLNMNWLMLSHLKQHRANKLRPKCPRTGVLQDINHSDFGNNIKFSVAPTPRSII